MGNRKYLAFALTIVAFLLLISITAPIQNAEAYIYRRTYYYGYYYPYYRYYYYYPYYYYYYPYYSYYYYSPQNTLTVQTSPSGIGGVTGGGTYSSGATTSFSVTNPIVSGGEGTRYVFTNWSGDYTGESTSGSVSMDGSKVVTANFKTQYELKVSANPPGIVSVVGGGWYDKGTKVDVSGAPSPVGDGSKRYVFVSWAVDGQPAPGNPISVVMDKPHTAVASYKLQYYLKVNSPMGTAQGEGWYDAGSTAMVAVIPSVPLEGIIGALGGKYVFDRWSGDTSAASPSAIIRMDGPHTVVANWLADYTSVYLIVGGVAVLAFALGAFAARLLPHGTIKLPASPFSRKREEAHPHPRAGRSNRAAHGNP